MIKNANYASSQLYGFTFVDSNFFKIFCLDDLFFARNIIKPPPPAPAIPQPELRGEAKSIKFSISRFVVFGFKIFLH